jgi:hypothetical protein
VQTVKRWWEADARRGPRAQREFLARVDSYRDEVRVLRSGVCGSSAVPVPRGLVTFLVYPPDDLVLVVKIQWLGGLQRSAPSGVLCHRARASPWSAGDDNVL